MHAWLASHLIRSITMVVNNVNASQSMLSWIPAGQGLPFQSNVSSAFLKGVVHLQGDFGPECQAAHDSEELAGQSFLVETSFAWLSMMLIGQDWVYIKAFRLWHDFVSGVEGAVVKSLGNVLNLVDTCIGEPTCRACKATPRQVCRSCCETTGLLNDEIVHHAHTSACEPHH